MEDYCMECLQVNNAITWLVDKFWKKYYGEDFKIERIDREDSTLHYNLQINDDHRNISDIYTALRYNIPRETLFEWMEKTVENILTHKPITNLNNFYLQNKKWESSSK